jgi:hypothetical protein
LANQGFQAGQDSERGKRVKSRVMEIGRRLSSMR